MQKNGLVKHSLFQILNVFVKVLFIVKAGKSCFFPYDLNFRRGCQPLSQTQTLGDSRAHHRYPEASRTRRKNRRLNGCKILHVAVTISCFPNHAIGGSCTIITGTWLLLGKPWTTLSAVAPFTSGWQPCTNDQGIAFGVRPICTSVLVPVLTSSGTSECCLNSQGLHFFLCAMG